MAEIISESVYLLALSVIDMFFKKIDRRLILLGAVPLICSFIYDDEITLISRLCGLAVGGVIFLAAVLTKERIGKADALILCFTGATLGVYAEFAMICAASLLCSIYAVAMMAMGRLNRKSRIAFVPFILSGYLMLLLA